MARPSPMALQRPSRLNGRHVRCLWIAQGAELPRRRRAGSGRRFDPPGPVDRRRARPAQARRWSGSVPGVADWMRLPRSWVSLVACSRCPRSASARANSSSRSSMSLMEWMPFMLRTWSMSLGTKVGSDSASASKRWRGVPKMVSPSGLRLRLPAPKPPWVGCQALSLGA